MNLSSPREIAPDRGLRDPLRRSNTPQTQGCGVNPASVPQSPRVNAGAQLMSVRPNWPVGGRGSIPWTGQSLLRSATAVAQREQACQKRNTSVRYKGLRVPATTVTALGGDICLHQKRREAFAVLIPPPRPAYQ